MSKFFSLGSRAGMEDIELDDDEDDEEDDESDFPQTPISSCFVPEEDDIIELETAGIELFEHQNNRKPTEEELRNFISMFGELNIIESYKSLKHMKKKEKEEEGTHREFLFSFIYYLSLNEINLEILQKVRSIISNQALKFLHYFLLDTEGHNGVSKLIQLWSSLKDYPARNYEMMSELILLFRTCLRHDYGVQHIVNSKVKSKSGSMISFFDDLLTAWYYARNQNRLMIQILDLMTLITCCCDDCFRNIQKFEENKEDLEKEREKVFMTQSMMMTSVITTRKKIQESKINFNQIYIPHPAHKKFLKAFTRFRKRMHEVVTFQSFVDRMVSKSSQHEYITRSLMFINQILHSTRFHHDEKNQKKFLEKLLSVGNGSLLILIKSLQHLDPDQKLQTQIKEFQSLLVFDEEYEVDYQNLPMEKMRQLYVQMKGKDSWMILSNILERFHRLNESMATEFRKRLEVQSLHFEEEIDVEVDKMMNNNWKRIEDIFKKVKFKRDLQRGEKESMNLPSGGGGGTVDKSTSFSQDEFNLVFGEDVEHSVEFKNLIGLLSTKDINDIQEDEISPPQTRSRWVDPTLDKMEKTSGAVKLFRKLVSIVNDQAKKRDEEIIDLKKKLAQIMRDGMMKNVSDEPLNIDDFEFVDFVEEGLGQGQGQGGGGGPSAAPAPPPPPPPPPQDPKWYKSFDITKYFKENKSHYEKDYTLRNLSVTRLKNLPEEQSIFLKKKIAKSCLSKVFSDLTKIKKKEEEEEKEEEEKFEKLEEEEESNNVKTNPKFFLSNLVKTFSKRKRTAEEIKNAKIRADELKRERESQVIFLDAKKTQMTEVLLVHQKKDTSEIIKCVMRFETQRLNVDVIKQLSTVYPREFSQRNDLKTKMEAYFNRPPSPIKGGSAFPTEEVVGGQQDQEEEEEGEEGEEGEEQKKKEEEEETTEKTREIRLKRLSDADKFLVKTLELDYYYERLQCWMFMESYYSQSVDRIESNLWRLDHSFDMLLEGKGGFFDFLKYVLVVANTLNSRKYPVYSFHISNLTNLSMMKPFASELSGGGASTAGAVKNSVLFYLLEYIYINDASSLEFVELYCDKFKFEMSIKEMNDDIVKLRKELQRVEIHRERESRVKDKFGEKASKFFVDGDYQVLNLGTKIEESFEKLKILGKLYAEEVGNPKTSSDPSSSKSKEEEEEEEQQQKKKKKEVSSSSSSSSKEEVIVVKRPPLVNLKDGFFKDLDEFLEICKKDIILVKINVELEKKRLKHQKSLRKKQLDLMNNNNNNNNNESSSSEHLDGMRNIDFIQRTLEQGRIINRRLDEDREDEGELSDDDDDFSD